MAEILSEATPLMEIFSLFHIFSTLFYYVIAGLTMKHDTLLALNTSAVYSIDWADAFFRLFERVFFFNYLVRYEELRYSSTFASDAVYVCHVLGKSRADFLIVPCHTRLFWLLGLEISTCITA